MAINKKALATILLFIYLISFASSQGYMGTVATGTGIVPPLTVGKSTSHTLNVGGLSSRSNLTGSLSLDLKGSDMRHLDLQVFQESDLTLGQGKMNIGGNNLPVVASGSVAGNVQTIFIYIIDRSEIFRLVLSAQGTALVGEYRSLSSAGVSEQGTVTGSFAPETGPYQSNALGEGTNPSATSGAWVGKVAESRNDGLAQI